MIDTTARKPDTARNRGKWMTLALLAALAAFMYLVIILKVARFGF